jgi:Flp pilus assembly protein TadG
MIKFFKDCRGNVVTLVAVSIPALAGTAAFSVDISRTYTVKTGLQMAADAGAYAAAGLVTDTESAIARALELVQKSAPADWGEIVTRSDIRFGRYNPADQTFVESSHDVNAVEVTTRRSKDRGNALKASFAQVFGVSETELTAKAIAVGIPSNVGPCVIALNPTLKDSFVISGSGTVSVPNCGIWVNSSSSTAMKQTGKGGLITAKFIGIVGSYGAASNISPTPWTGRPAVPDPLAGVPEPVAPLTCTYNAVTFSTPLTLPGGSTYCGKIALNANITFGPGIHYFKGADVTTSSAVDINGSGVTLYFDATSKFTSTSSGTVNLSAPTKGPYKGIAIFGSRAANKLIIKLTGNKDYFVNGTIYLPEHYFHLYGSADLTVNAKSGYVIANQFYYQGNSSFTMDTFGNAGTVPSALSGSTRVSLVK